MKYKLIAFDMDGTLLNSNKQISKKTQEAIARAVAYNKIVIFKYRKKLCRAWKNIY